MRWAKPLALGLVALSGCFGAGSGPPDGGPADAAGDRACTFICGDGGGVVDPFGDASVMLRTRALFLQTCAGGPESGCHSENAANFKLSLDPDGGDVIDVPSTEMPGLVRVKPFATDQSYLFWKVSADPRIDGGAMPLNAAFDPRIPALIGAWIDAGAPTQ